MPAKTASLIATIMTILGLMLFAVLTALFEMVALNGASERQGLTALSLSLACNGIAAVLGGFLAWWLTNTFISRFNWNKSLAVVLALIAGLLVGGAVSFLAIVISIPLVEYDSH